MSTYRCPECGGEDLKVSVSVFCYFLQPPDDGNHVGDICGNNEWFWDQDSAMLCMDCHHGGKVLEFEKEGTHDHQD